MSYTFVDYVNSQIEARKQRLMQMHTKQYKNASGVKPDPSEVLDLAYTSYLHDYAQDPDFSTVDFFYSSHAAGKLTVHGLYCDYIHWVLQQNQESQFTVSQLLYQLQIINGYYLSTLVDLKAKSLVPTPVRTSIANSPFRQQTRPTAVIRRVPEEIANQVDHSDASSLINTQFNDISREVEAALPSAVNRYQRKYAVAQYMMWAACIATYLVSLIIPMPIFAAIPLSVASMAAIGAFIAFGGGLGESRQKRAIQKEPLLLNQAVARHTASLNKTILKHVVEEGKTVAPGLDQAVATTTTVFFIARFNDTQKAPVDAANQTVSVAALATALKCGR